MTTVLSAVIFLACTLTLSAAQRSCGGRCGEEYYRSYICNCDFDCLVHDECCNDYESLCTTKNSCQGRCGEQFKRGRQCSCDVNCLKYNQCCPDFKNYCEAEAPPNPTDTQDEPEQEETFTIFPQTEVSPTDPSDDQPAQTKAIPSVVEPTIAVSPEEADSSNPEGPSDLTKLSASGNTLPVSSSPQSTPINTTGYQVLDQTNPSSMPQTRPTTVEDLQLEGPEPVNVDIQLESQTDDLVKPTPKEQEDNHSTTLTSTAATQESSSAPEGSVPDPTSPYSTTPSSINPDQTPSLSGPTTPSSPKDDPKDNALITPTKIPSSPLGPDAVDHQTPESVKEPEPEVQGGTPETWTGLGATSEGLTTCPTSPADPGLEKEVVPETTDDPRKLTTAPTDTNQQVSEPQEKTVSAKPTPAKPVSKPQPKPTLSNLLKNGVNIDNPRDYQGDDANDTNLCSGRPASAVTTLRNGTMVVFRGHYFWMLNSNKVPGQARDITDVWGVPSPVDTIFTRCNCQGKTYIFKGSQYWRFDNDVVDPGYPKLISTGFDGLQGQIMAALSVPEYRRRPESVYFFKRGGLVQKYSYKFGTSPTCGRKLRHAVYTIRNRVARQAVSQLGPSINIRVSWKGFPSTVTSAVSVPTRRRTDGYNYYVFSRSKYYNVKMEDERPAIVAPPTTTPQKNSAKDFFNCPKEV